VEVAGAAPDPAAPLLQIPVLPFGAALDAARGLGRPDAFEWKNRHDKDGILLYAKKGLRLRFRGDSLIEFSYLIAWSACDHPSFAPSQPLASDGARLTPQTDRARIVKVFGEPDPQGSEDTCLQIFHGNGVISDFYLDDGGHLTEWVLYPDD
jgi:hypothetical protein